MSDLEHVPTLPELAARGHATMRDNTYTPDREGQQMIHDAMRRNAEKLTADGTLRRQTSYDAVRAARGRV